MVILPNGQLGWLYGITLSHNGIEGFGKTERKTPRPRLVGGYINHSACLQTFHVLWYGLFQRLESVESYIKNQYNDKMLILLDKELEWFNPTSGITSQDYIQIVEDRIRAKGWTNEIFRVKSEHLPFTHRTIYKNIRKNPNHYLEQI